MRMDRTEAIKITSIYWENIYLHLTLEGSVIAERYFITDGKEEYYSIERTGNEIVVNIVNIPNIKLLGNGKWYFAYEKTGHMHLMEITVACGYSLRNLDRIYRYGAKKYAYIINFEAESYVDDQKKIDAQVASSDVRITEKLTCTMQTSYMMLNKREGHRNILIESGSFSQLIRKMIIICIKHIIQRIYLVLSYIRRHNGKRILLMSETRVPIGGNLKALDDRLKERKLDQQFHISYSFSKTLQQSKVKTFFVWSRLLWLISGQDFIFVDDYVPIFKTIHLRKCTQLIQLWHAGVGFKSVGYSRFGKAGSPHPLDSCHRQYDYAVVGSKGLIPVYEEVFGIEKSKFLPYGLPRLDGYMDESRIHEYKQRFYGKYPQLINKRIILFAPTYRGNGQREAYYPLEMINQKQLYEVLGDTYVFAYKMHPFITEKVDIISEYKDKIYDFSNEGDINSLFYVTDVLITDFSSNIYEFALQRKPIIFYAYDKDFYQLTRGVHRTLEEAPGIVCETFEEVIHTLKERRFQIDKLEKFIQESFVSDTDQLASDRIIDKILLGKDKVNGNEK